MTKRVARLASDERGGGLVEYALIVALIAIASIGGVRSLGAKSFVFVLMGLLIEHDGDVDGDGHIDGLGDLIANKDGILDRVE
ncbi:Flp family type IVb pilin [Amorphus sp. MBR-141]